MIQKDQDAINWLIEVVKEVKSYTNTLGQIKVVRERLRVMDFQISDTGGKDPYTQWVHCEHIGSTDNMWPQCAQWAHFDHIQNLPPNVVRATHTLSSQHH